MPNLHVGDRVRVIASGCTYCDQIIGAIGTVCDLEEHSDRPGVEFDNPVRDGHDCMGYAKPGYGRYICPEALEPLSPYSFNQNVIEEMINSI